MLPSPALPEAPGSSIFPAPRRLLPCPMLNLYDHTRAALGEQLAPLGFSGFHRDLVWEALYRRHVTGLDAAQLPGLREELRGALAGAAQVGALATHLETFSQDGFTHKLLLRL